MSRFDVGSRTREASRTVDHSLSMSPAVLIYAKVDPFVVDPIEFSNGWSRRVVNTHPVVRPPRIDERSPDADYYRTGLVNASLKIEVVLYSSYVRTDSIKNIIPQVMYIRWDAMGKRCIRAKPR